MLQFAILSWTNMNMSLRNQATFHSSAEDLDNSMIMITDTGDYLGFLHKGDSTALSIKITFVEDYIMKS